MERPLLSFTLRWGAWLSEMRPSQDFVLITRGRAPSFNKADVGYLHRGRVTFR